jgi:ABC-2 type transport system permease protein
MRSLIALTIANIKSFVRDRAALFWTFAFPIVFVMLFGSIFSGGGTPTYKIGWVDQDASAASQGLRQGFDAVPLFKVTEASSEDAALADMREGKLDAVIVTPKGVGDAVASADSAAAGEVGPIISLKVYTDPSKSTSSQLIQQVVTQVVGVVNQRLSGRPPVLGLTVQPLQTQQISNAAYFVPSILAMALMQLGVFSAIPLVAQREKLILKRLSATPLRRWMLVGSNLAMRLLIALIQSVLIISIGAVLFGVTVIGNLLLMAALIGLGALTFISIGYVIASYAKTEDSANALTSVVQFPLMFLSGIFFPIEIMPEFLRPVATLMPLTYLGDALRQVMVGGSPFAPLPVDVLVLGGWLVVSFLISARFFRWQ